MPIGGLRYKLVNTALLTTHGKKLYEEGKLFRYDEETGVLELNELMFATQKHLLPEGDLEKEMHKSGLTIPVDGRIAVEITISDIPFYRCKKFRLEGVREVKYFPHEKPKSKAWGYPMPP